MQRWRTAFFIRGVQTQTHKGLTRHFLSWLQPRGIGDMVEKLKSSAADSGKAKQNRPWVLQLVRAAKVSTWWFSSWVYTKSHLKQFIWKLTLQHSQKHCSQKARDYSNAHQPVKDRRVTAQQGDVQERLHSKT